MAEDYVFIGRQYFNDEILSHSTFIELGDGAKLIFNDACNIELENITFAFLSSPGVDPSKAGVLKLFNSIFLSSWINPRRIYIPLC